MLPYICFKQFLEDFYFIFNDFNSLLHAQSLNKQGINLFNKGALKRQKN